MKTLNSQVVFFITCETQFCVFSSVSISIYAFPFSLKNWRNKYWLKMNGFDIWMLACSFWLNRSLWEVMQTIEDFPQHTGLQCQTAFICTFSGINPWMHTARLKLSALIIRKPSRRACHAQSRITFLISFRHFILERNGSVTNFSKSDIQFLTHWKWKVHLRYIQGQNKH